MLRLDIFDTYWKIMKSNYQDTRHTEFDYKYYWAIFKDYKEEDFIKAIKLVLKFQPYFPRVDEIVKYLPEIEQELPDWWDKKIESVEPNEEELEEINEFLKGMTNE